MENFMQKTAFIPTHVRQTDSERGRRRKKEREREREAKGERVFLRRLPNNIDL